MLSYPLFCSTCTPSFFPIWLPSNLSIFSSLVTPFRNPNCLNLLLSLHLHRFTLPTLSLLLHLTTNLASTTDTIASKLVSPCTSFIIYLLSLIHSDVSILIFDRFLLNSTSCLRPFDVLHSALLLIHTIPYCAVTYCGVITTGESAADGPVDCCSARQHLCHLLRP
jgi:hypothetical protein